MTHRVEHLAEGVTLHLGDCREILPTIGKVDAVVTDPPYGIGKDGQAKSSGKHGGRKAYDFIGWDGVRPAEKIFQQILGVSDRQCIWGGNYFADFLPPSMRWLVWDKGQRINQSDGELAWTSEQAALRIFTLNRVALLMEGAQHPTQKPVEVMKWSIQQIGCPRIICDPFMGSGTTGVAAAKMGLGFIGIELHEPYFDIACRRIADALSRPDLFVERPSAPVQEALAI
ncbi:hypothetical protein ASG40_11565 [Methylobacterium sp. Leaf399]|uniref:DNA-methyltransferase n=1 Tax=Methylobacterium sp. Leaf399 TaxID=1736364 RepID=UPI000701EA6F|nr:DNA methyltransferase [Methylobacterium sp. Leaf399]KQT08511.1 hypothetical protein ASG40_11565 [Methylobacterium sp. Leaf399]